MISKDLTKKNGAKMKVKIVNAPPAETTKTPKAKTKRQEVEDYLSYRFVFRYNVLNGRIEYTGKASNKFECLEDYSLNSIIRQIDSEAGISTSPDKLKVILKSDFTPCFNPLQAYFKSLAKPRNSETPTIQALANTVTVEKPQLFTLSLTKWLVASVANAFITDGCQNHTCLVLTGTQGSFKTTWLNMLCPTDLLKYLYCGKINLDNKDTLILLGEKFIINLDDQLRTLNKKDGETVKTLITQGNVTVRRPYDALFSELPRIASFVGSVNGNDFLSDPTGSRRFLPFEAQQIDIEAAQRVDINQVWAEAYALYQQDYKYWFTASETAELFENNEAFQVHTQEYESLLEYYQPATEGDSATTYLTTSNIQNNLKNFTRQDIRTKQLGEALRKAGFSRQNKKINGQPVYVWAIRAKSEVEREAQNRQSF
jgi:predicted P-loop ATPase